VRYTYNTYFAACSSYTQHFSVRSLPDLGFFAFFYQYRALGSNWNVFMKHCCYKACRFRYICANNLLIIRGQCNVKFHSSSRPSSI